MSDNGSQDLVESADERRVTVTPAKRIKRRADPGPVAAPSRMRSKRQAQIVQMVKGYDSTFTISVALRNIFLLWTLVGGALLVFGVMAASTDPLSAQAATTQRTIDAIRSGSLLLLVFTFVACGGWLSKSVANVHRLGRKASFGILARLRRHILAACFGVIALVFVLFIPPLALAFLLVAVSLFFYSQMWLHLVLLDVVKMLWGTSSPPNGQHEDVDHYVLIWFWSWVAFISLLVADMSPNEFSPQTLDAFTMVAGAACVVSALLASRLVMAISKRQDARLYAIIHEVDEGAEAKPVTDQDIAAAWNRSAAFIEMPH